MERQLLPKYELEWRLAEAFSKHNECSMVRNIQVVPQQPDDTGCNWNVQASTGGNAGDLNCQACALDVVRDLRAQYNILDAD